jgi:putative FmdB family regulatory protein
MPEYSHLCKNCSHKWNEIYSIHSDPPTLCPNCKTEGFVNRLITGAPYTKVELYGSELYSKLRAEGKQIAKEAEKNEKLAENLYGAPLLPKNE